MKKIKGKFMTALIRIFLVTEASWSKSNVAVQKIISGRDKDNFITTENYHIRLKPNTAKLFIEKIKNNFNQRYEFRNKQHTLENIMFENIKELSRYIMDNSKQLEFSIPEIEIKRNDNS